MSAIQTDHPLQTADASSGVLWEAPKGVRVILGSQSFTRKLLLREMGVNFECVPADIDEREIRRDDPEELVQALANAKAEALLQRTEIATASTDGGTVLLLTSDQVVVHDGKIREKPESKDEAREFIRGYGKSAPSTVGAIAVTNLQSGKRVMELDTATIHFTSLYFLLCALLSSLVFFLAFEFSFVSSFFRTSISGILCSTFPGRPIPEDVIESIVAQDMVLKCAGGLMVEDPLVQPYLVKIEGGMDSVMGLGKRLVHRLLSSALQP